MSIGDYVNWDKATEALLMAKNSNSCALESIRLRLKDIDNRLKYELSEDKVSDLKLERHELMTRFRALDNELNIFELAWNALNSEERVVLDEIYLKCPSDKMAAVFNACQRIGCEQASIYRIRKEALKKFKTLLG